VVDFGSFIHQNNHLVAITDKSCSVKTCWCARRVSGITFIKYTQCRKIAKPNN